MMSSKIGLSMKKTFKKSIKLRNSTLILLSRENTSEIFHRNRNGQAIQEINLHENIHRLPEFHVPNIPLDDYENCRTIPKHQISCAKVGFLNDTNSLRAHNSAKKNIFEFIRYLKMTHLIKFLDSSN